MTPDAVFVGTVLVMAAGLAAAWGGEWLADRRQAR